MFILAQIIGIAAAGFNVAAMYLKEKKNILKLMIVSSIAFAINMFMLGGISGGVISLIGAIQTFINYQYDKREIKYPKWLIALYMIIAVICGMFSYKALIDILPVICSVLFSISILQNKEKNIRITMLLMFILWTIYSFVIRAYSTAIVDGIQSVLTFIAIIKNDIAIRKNT